MTLHKIPSFTHLRHLRLLAAPGGQQKMHAVATAIHLVAAQH